MLLLTGLTALGLAIVLAVVALAAGGRRRDRTANALDVIERRYARRPQEAAGDAARPLEPPLTWLHALAVRLTPAGAVTSLQRRLDIAGQPARWNADRVLAAKGLGLVAVGGIGALYVLNSPFLGLAGALAGGTAGFFLPDLLLYNAGTKRQEQLQLGLPDAMDLLTICVEAGLGFDAALGRVAASSDGPLAAELARVLQEMQIGLSRSEALRALAARTTVPELRAFVSALVQASGLGVAIADVLRQQAKEMRLRRRQLAEEKAQKVPVKILLPLMTCLFPALFVLVVGPGVMNIAHTLFRK